MATGKEEWRLCADWLVRCRILAYGHRATSEHADVFDLAQTLRDGVLLCHLLNVLSPNSVDLRDFSQRPQLSQFLCLKNIRIFLQTCKHIYGMPEKELFDSYDLFDVRNFGKVISTLSKLSKSPHAVKSGIKGFPPEHDTSRAQDDYEDDDEIYSGLELRAFDEGLDEDIYDMIEDAEEQEEQIYGIYVERRRRPSQGVLEPKSQKDFCMKEIIQSEKNYIDVLNMIVVHFIRPLQNILTQTDKDLIFKNIEPLLQIHTVFQSELSRACASGLVNVVGDCFVKWKTKFFLYSEYCSNLLRAQDHVDEVSRQNQLVAQSIAGCEMKANKGAFRLRDMLVVPMQRVLKYPLLLKELIRHTDKFSGELPSLEKGLEAMQDLALYINEVKRDNEIIHTIDEIENSITDLLMPENTSLKDYGRLLKDGELKVKSQEDKNSNTRYIFLFDKVMLMCRAVKGESYSYKSALILSQYKVDEATLSHIKGEKWSHQFSLIGEDQSIAYTFYPRTEDIRRKWIEAVYLALDNTQPAGHTQGGHDFVMHTYIEPKECDICKKLLRGVFFQGYQCQATGMSVHKECIAKAGGAPNLPPRRGSVDGIGVRQPRPPNTLMLDSNKHVICKAKATDRYLGNPMPSNSRPHLMFEVGTVVDVLSTEDPHWYEGRHRGQQGFFPARCVKLLGTGNRKAIGKYEETQLLQPVSPPGGSCNPGHEDHYVNLGDLSGYQWYAGEMDRDGANHTLKNRPDGTFLVRMRGGADKAGGYAMSIKFRDVRHVKVHNVTAHGPSGQERNYYLSDCKMFLSIPELVEYYQYNTLEGSFPELKTTLGMPYKPNFDTLSHDGAISPRSPTEKVVFSRVLGPISDTNYAVAIFDFAATATNQISLRRGDRIQITSKAGSHKGWWKGELNGQVGYFPHTFVVEEES